MLYGSYYPNFSYATWISAGISNQSYWRLWSTVRVQSPARAKILFISFECCCALLPSWRDLSGRNRFFNKKDPMFCQRSGKRILHKSDKRLSIKLCQQNVRVFGPTPFPVRPRGMRLGLIYSNKSFLIISAFGHTLFPLCGNVHNGCLLMTTRDK